MRVAGATVVVVGSAVRTTANTGSTGVARIAVSPARPGVLLVGLRGERACSIQRAFLERRSPDWTG